VKTRSYGLFASARRADLQVAHQLLAIQSDSENRSPLESSDLNALPVEGPDANDPDPRCTVCNAGSMRIVAEIPRSSAATWTWARAPPETVAG